MTVANLTSIFFGARYVDWDDAKELPRATFLTLRAAVEGDWQDPLASIERAETHGFFAIDLGLPDRPEKQNLAKFNGIVDAVACLDMLKDVYPTIGLWLSTVEVLAEITDRNVWHGVIQARAMHDPSDGECDWVKLAADITAGRMAPRGYDHNPAAERITHFI